MDRQIQRSLVRSSLRLAAQIGVVRLLILWTAILLYSSFSDWRQTMGYLGLVGNSLFEVLLLRGWRGDESAWVIALSVAVASTSIFAAFVGMGFEHYVRGRNKG